MSTSDGTTYFHYSCNKVIAETDANNKITTQYTWDTFDNPVTMTKAGKVYYYHINGHGDVTALTDENGNAVAQYEYDAWGNIISQIGTMASLNPYRYAGYRFDETTGLYYLMNRYYKSDNPMVIKTLTNQALTVPSEDNQGLSLLSNLYAYSANNPVMYVDPSG